MKETYNILKGKSYHIESFKYSTRNLPLDLRGRENKAICTLDYPFHKPKTIEFTFTTITDIVKAVRDGLIEMYKVSEPQPQSPMLINQTFNGEYGAAYHSIGDLYIDGITYNPTTCELTVDISS